MASARRLSKTEPFPTYTPDHDEASEKPADSTREPGRRPSITSRLSKTPPSLRSRTRTGSLSKSFLESNPPLGMWQATAEIGSKIPTLPEIRNGAFADEGWTHEGQMEHRGTNPHEIHARRVARTSSASTRTRKSSVSANAPAVIAEETHEYFPKRSPVMVQATPLVEEGSSIHPSEPPHAAAEEIGRLDGSEKTDSSSRRDESVPPSIATSVTGPQVVPVASGPDETGTYPNGYRFPKKHTWTQSINIGLKAYWKFLKTPFGVVVTIYGLNVVGWGAMIFFVLLNAAPAMCHPTCEADSSARQKWIEIDSQVLNGLFCVTAFGLLPWRGRDFYYLMRWRMGGNQVYHRKLAGIYRAWYRLPGSDQLEEHVGPPPAQPKKKQRETTTAEAPPPYTPEEIAKLEENPAVPLPATSMPEPPLTGIRAPSTRSWTLDAVIWLYMWNTIFQVLLCVWMWNWNRFDRPTWGTGVWITLGCLVAIFAGLVAFREGVRVKKIEGIPVQEYDVLESVEDYQERKAKEDAKEAKKLDKHEHHRHFRHGGAQKVVHSEKLKGHEWFTRH
ncbi:hypothetical protein A1O7_06420 [Cladophialophora yegresii CBS 114405]|uniref:Uncharacterized protein n=1 Tax=Cladophialophora yegresii CBS 114405 TaxID=1182544 RepID=W9WKK4_9EURO|nr:uncharacterized protein A1O7_06420 [Cladophialophora yegresii CBS 114405]EXJ58989.1 hypothetical protein A1O7_06420 [Cladophialophora yegresii CBS 114405]